MPKKNGPGCQKPRPGRKVGQDAGPHSNRPSGKRQTSLTDEFSDALCSITRERFSELTAAGIPEVAVNQLMVGRAPIESRQGGLFDFAEDGEYAAIVPVGRAEPWDRDLVDLCAFHLDNPTRWWLRLGIADVLGDLHGFTVEPKRLHATPLDWLKAGGRGLVVLDWKVDLVDLLLGAGPLVADLPLKLKVRQTAVKAAAATVDRMIAHA